MAERTSRSHSRSRSRSRSPAPAEDSAPPAAAEEAAPIKAENQDVDASTEASCVTTNSASNDTNQEENRPLEIYIGNLAFSTRDDDLETLFRTECPNLIEAKVVMARNHPSRSRGFAFAKVLTQEEADKIISKFHESEVDGRTLRVNMSGQKTERAERKTTTNSGGPGETELYVGSLAW